MLARRIFLFFLAFLTALLTITFPTENQAATTCSNQTEIRGVWLTNIDSDVLFSRDKTKNALKTLAKLNFNTLYPTVWNWGYTLYPSEIAAETTGVKLDPNPGLQNRDILKEIIKQGHKQKMKVIPWFEFGFMAPADSELAEKHPEWLTNKQDGETIWLEGNVHKRVWLNPLKPEVQQFITKLITEIVSNYEVDGIQLDDHFGYPSDFGYDDYTVQLYQQEHEGKLPPTNSKDAEWVQWRADKITEYVKDLFKAIKAHNPQAIVSVSPNPQEFSLEYYLLDWQRWERIGLIEELVLQVYRNNLADYLREITQASVIAAQKHIPVAIGILAGLKGRPVSFNLIDEQIKAARANQLAGVSFFFYESLWHLSDTSPEIRKANFAEVFRHCHKYTTDF